MLEVWLRQFVPRATERRRPLARPHPRYTPDVRDLWGCSGWWGAAGVARAWVLDRMTDSMVHRGPDDRGTYEAAGVALGARRLSIVDVAGGHQPVRNEEGTVWAAQNGELYNHLELRRQLERDGHRLASRCDTEILPHLYERDGERYPERLRGKFAIAVWDGARRRAVLARDRLGVKPLYWAAAMISSCSARS